MVAILANLAALLRRSKKRRASGVAMEPTAVAFGRYLLLDRIDVGGMAEVWRARESRRGGPSRVVAIKRTLPLVQEDAELTTLFLAEGALAMQLHHPHIAEVVELNRVGQSLYMALEYVAGRDLAAVLKRCQQLRVCAPTSFACTVAAACAEGLAYAHAATDQAGRPLQVFHQDISPRNIMVGYSGEVKLIDFGIARVGGHAISDRKGKVGYMSPEQRKGGYVDKRSDIFALGVCFYELLAGERLFPQRSRGSSDSATASVPAPSLRNPAVPRPLDAVILKATAVDVEERYQCAGDFADALREAMGTCELPCSSAGVAETMQRLFAVEFATERERFQALQGQKEG